MLTLSLFILLWFQDTGRPVPPPEEVFTTVAVTDDRGDTTITLLYPFSIKEKVWVCIDMVTPSYANRPLVHCFEPSRRSYDYATWFGFPPDDRKWSVRGRLQYRDKGELREVISEWSEVTR